MKSSQNARVLIIFRQAEKVTRGPWARVCVCVCMDGAYIACAACTVVYRD